jgi:hypothetical protein
MVTGKVAFPLSSGPLWHSTGDAPMLGNAGGIFFHFTANKVLTLGFSAVRRLSEPNVLEFKT